MRLAEKNRVPLEAHFTEGELDLEPPEEMAIGELDDEAILEEELDNEDLLEQDVEEDTLEASLEALVHGADEDDDDADAQSDEAYVAGALVVGGADTEDSEDPDDGLGADDHEESLDLVLLDRLALVDDGTDDDEDDDDVPSVVESLLVQLHTDSVDLGEVVPRRADEFVCPSCFLVRKRVQLVDSATMACHDCST
jgi:hypothetical protein